MAAPIHQEVDFKANSKRVYEALTDAKQFSVPSAVFLPKLMAKPVVLSTALAGK